MIYHRVVAMAIAISALSSSRSILLSMSLNTSQPKLDLLHSRTLEFDAVSTIRQQALCTIYSLPYCSLNIQASIDDYAGKRDMYDF